MSDPAGRLIRLSRELAHAVSSLSFSPPVTHVYNPLQYAREGWEAYLRLSATGPREAVFLGMNPGPWGMAQTGIPFGEVEAVREWMGISPAVGQPELPHPKRPIEGLDCPRSEVSGRRLWGLMRERFATAEAFFSHHFVANYCPLVFMAESGRNVTPDKLPAADREPLFRHCDAYLRETIAALAPRWVIGVGKFAEARIRAALPAGAGSDPDHAGRDLPVIGTILHPSPANPAANRGWSQAATRQLTELGVWQ